MTPDLDGARQLELSPPALALRKPGANSHVSFDGAYYSIPHTLFGNTVIIRASDTHIDILDCNGACVASHQRSFVKHKYITDPTHLPEFSYSLIGDDRYDGARLRKWAERIGASTSLVIDAMLDRKKYEEHAYKSCLAVLLLSKQYGSFILERACKKAVAAGSFNHTAIQRLAKFEYDRHFSNS